MKKGRCLGLVGGLGVGATIHYYQKLASAHEAQGRTMDIVIAHAETARVFEYVKACDPGGLAEYLNGFLRRLKAAGAEVGVVPAVTPLYCVRELVATSPLSLISMIDPLAAELASREHGGLRSSGPAIRSNRDSSGCWSMWSLFAPGQTKWT
jgi:aspartate racemase